MRGLWHVREQYCACLFLYFFFYHLHLAPVWCLGKNCSSLLWNNWNELGNRHTRGLWENLWSSMCVGQRARVCLCACAWVCCHVKYRPHLLHLVLPLLLSSLTVINDPQLSKTLLTMFFLSFFFSLYVGLWNLVGSNEGQCGHYQMRNSDL